MAHFADMRWFAVDRRWQAAYQRVVLSSFRTVPLYRERWALSGRTDPVVVAGRTGAHGGAIQADEALRRQTDLVPLAGGEHQLDPHRGLGAVLAGSHAVPRGTVVAVLDPASPRPPADLPTSARGQVLDPRWLVADQPAAPELMELISVLRRDGTVVAVGSDADLSALATLLPDEAAPRLKVAPVRRVDGLVSTPGGLLHDPMLGYLGSFQRCGRWHVDWRSVYVRSTTAGLAFTLLRQRSPRLVDILVGGGVTGSVETCPTHGTPVVVA